MLVTPGSERVKVETVTEPCKEALLYGNNTVEFL